VDKDDSREFFEDFGAPRLGDREVDDLLRRTRASGDRDLRRAVKEVRMWRRLAPALLDRLLSTGVPASDADSLLALARFLIRGEGPRMNSAAAAAEVSPEAAPPSR
jgi:hypothetical protein